MALIHARNQHRHLKTLIVLVLSMTGGTIFLYWVGRLTPVTPLRAKASPAWNQIIVRPADPAHEDGFFHLKVDEKGRLVQSPAWLTQQPAEGGEGVIQLLVTSAAADDRITPLQTKTLAQTITSLRRDYRIPADRVHIRRSRHVAGLTDRLGS
jgi:hypothetical protein